MFWVCSGGQDSESGSFASLWEYVARRLAVAYLASWEVWGPPSLPCVLWSRVDGSFTHCRFRFMRLMWANGRKQESFIFSVCVCLIHKSRNVVEVKEVYNALKKLSTISQWHILYILLHTFIHSDFAFRVCTRYMLSALCSAVLRSAFLALSVRYTVELSPPGP